MENTQLTTMLNNLEIQEDVLSLRLENSRLQYALHTLIKAFNEVKYISLNASPSKLTKECLCCKAPFLTDPYAEQDFCDSCFPIVCKAVFDKANGSLTCEQLAEKLRGFNVKDTSST